MKEEIIHADGGTAVLGAGIIPAITGVIEGAFGLGATAIQTKAQVKINESNNDTLVKTTESNNNAKVKMSEIWSKHSSEIITGILLVVVIIVLAIYLLKSK